MGEGYVENNERKIEGEKSQKKERKQKKVKDKYGKQNR